MNLAADNRSVMILFWGAGVVVAAVLLVELGKFVWQFEFKQAVKEDAPCCFGVVLILGALFAVALLFVWLAGGFRG